MAHQAEDRLRCDAFVPTEPSDRSPSTQQALATALRVAVEAAVFPNRFEIDEQEPLSRLDALAEELVLQVHNLRGRALFDVDTLDGEAEAVLIINRVTERIRASISKTKP